MPLPLMLLSLGAAFRRRRSTQLLLLLLLLLLARRSPSECGQPLSGWLWRPAWGRRASSAEPKGQGFSERRLRSSLTRDAQFARPGQQFAVLASVELASCSNSELSNRRRPNWLACFGEPAANLLARASEFARGFRPKFSARLTCNSAGLRARPNPNRQERCVFTVGRPVAPNRRPVGRAADYSRRIREALL